MNINEITRIDRKSVVDEDKYWALFSKQFYENLFLTINDREELKDVYNYWLKYRKLEGREKDALTFFYRIRRDELDNVFKWNESKKSIKAQFVFENITKFQKSNSEKTFKEQLFPSKVKEALLKNMYDVEMDGYRNWIEREPVLQDVLDYNLDDPLEITQIMGFDSDSYCEEFDIDEDDLNSEFTKEYSIKSKRSEGINADIGHLRDGSKVIHYWGGLVDGFIARKEWLTESISFKKSNSEEEFKDSLFSHKIRIVYYENNDALTDEEGEGTLEAAKDYAEDQLIELRNFSNNPHNPRFWAILSIFKNGKWEKINEIEL